MVALKSLSPVIVIVVLSIIAAVALGFMVVAFVKAKKATPAVGLSTHLTGLLGNPLIQRLASHVVTAAQASHHAALDAGIVKLLPAAAPFIPLINAVADRVDAKVVGTPAPALPQPGDPATRPIIEFLESHLAKLKGMT
jgi:hypothetical protein